MAETSDSTGFNASAPAAKARRKSPARRSAAGARRSPARKKPGARRATKKAPASLEGLLRDFSRRASDAGASIVSLSGEGLDSARKALGQAGTASKATIERLTREWRKMDTRKRAQFVAALLGALAAASAPLVRSRLKKR